MNFFKRIYCRSFQLCMKLALPVLPYKDPKVYKSLSDVVLILEDNKKKKPLVVTDKSLSELGLINLLLDELRNANVEFALYDGTVQNPTTANVEEAYELYKKEGCDSLIAFGGGSPMDCAKGVGARIARPKKYISKLAGILHVRHKIPLLTAIPTTAGTGSETTLACVLVDSNTRHKYAINDFPLIPKYAVLDPKVTLSLPPKIISTTGMDALTHAIESFIGKSGNKKTRKDALEASKIIFENLENAYNNKDEESLGRMLWASHLAGRSFSKAYVGYVHAIAHALGGKYNIPHGLANSVILPIVLREYGKKIYKKMYKLGVYTGIVSKSDTKKDAFEKVVTKIEGMNSAFNIPKNIDGIIPSDIKALAKNANHEANPLYPCPVLWNRKKLEEMFKKVGNINE